MAVESLVHISLVILKKILNARFTKLAMLLHLEFLHTIWFSWTLLGMMATVLLPMIDFVRGLGHKLPYCPHVVLQVVSN